MNKSVLNTFGTNLLHIFYFWQMIKQKYYQPYLFFKVRKISSKSFDALISELKVANILNKKWNNKQISIKRQVLIILKCFSLYRNNIF